MAQTVLPSLRLIHLIDDSVIDEDNEVLEVDKGVVSKLVYF